MSTAAVSRTTPRRARATASAVKAVDIPSAQGADSTGVKPARSEMVGQPADGTVEHGDLHGIRIRVRSGVGDTHRVGPQQHEAGGQHPRNRLCHQPRPQVVALQRFGDEREVRDQDHLGGDGRGFVLVLDLPGEAIAVEQPGRHLVVAVDVVRAQGDRVLGSEPEQREVEGADEPLSARSRGAHTPISATGTCPDPADIRATYR